MAIPNCQHIVERLSREFPDEWRKAHNPSGGGPETEAFIRRLAYVLHTTVSPNFGLNAKRGNYNDLSDDVVNWIGEGPGHDPKTGSPVTVIDVIGGAGGPDPRPMWMPFSDLPGPGGWVKPEPVAGVVTPPPSSDIWTPAHEAIRVRMAGRSAVNLAEQLAHSFPDEQWGQKRTSGGDWSPDTIGRLVGGVLWAVRVIPAVTIYGLLPSGHVHRQVQAVNHLGEVPPVAPPPVTPPPVVVPPVVVPPVDPGIAPALVAIHERLSAIEAAIAKQREEVLAAVRGQSYEIDANVRMLGPVRGTITPKGQA